MARKGLRGEALFGERAPLETQTFFLGAANGGFEPMYVPAAVRKSSIARLQEVADMYPAFSAAWLAGCSFIFIGVFLVMRFLGKESDGSGIIVPVKG